MLRTLICASLLSLATLASPAFAEDVPLSEMTPMQMRVVSDDGVTIGRVNSVGRNAQGRLVSVHAEGLAPPADAPAQPNANRGLAHLPPYQRPPNVAMNEQARGAGSGRMEMR